MKTSCSHLERMLEYLVNIYAVKQSRLWQRAAAGGWRLSGGDSAAGGRMSWKNCYFRAGVRTKGPVCDIIINYSDLRAILLRALYQKICRDFQWMVRLPVTRVVGRCEKVRWISVGLFYARVPGRNLMLPNFFRDVDSYVFLLLH